jgi:putative effector of murein hydrolase LrgA (UPF0299 family)
MFEGDWWRIVTQPLAALFLVFAVFGLFGNTIINWISRRRS